MSLGWWQGTHGGNVGATGHWAGLKGQQMVVDQQAADPDMLGSGQGDQEGLGGRDGGRSPWLGLCHHRQRDGADRAAFQRAVMTRASPEHQASSLVSYRT